jgi:uncharacterized protein (UPF0332 family)
MITEEARSLIALRIEQADEALRDAGFLLDHGGNRAVINRAYYAMFYAVLALLIIEGKGTSKHRGAIALFDKDFVKSGGFDKKFSEWLHAAFDDRMKSDYRIAVVPSHEEAIQILEHARAFVVQVKTYLAETIGPFKSN